MANITIFVTTMQPQNNKIALGGLVYSSPNSGPFSFECEHEWDTIAFDINAMIKETAIAVLAAENINVTEGDKKTLYCGAADI
jgi:hypothetical protein